MSRMITGIAARRRSHLTFALLCGAGGLALPAAAQTTVDADEEVIEEIVVTARHRSESIQRVPISMSAVSSETLQEQHINTMQELEFTVPNLVFGETGSSGETHIGIRGIGDFSRNIGFDTRVGVYIDGVFAGQSLSVDQGLVDIRQVEVLRGPQGTLFGKNSSSGAINIITNAPEIGQTSGELTFGGGNLENIYGSAVANLPLGDTLAARLAVVAQHQDGYVKNLFNNKKLMTNDHLLARGRLRYEPNEALTVDLSFDIREQNNDILFLEPDDSYELAVGNPAAVGPLVVDQDADLIDDNSGWGMGATAQYHLPSGYVLTSITGFRHAERKVGSDEDATRVFTLDARYFQDDFDHVTQEVRLASPDSQAFRYVVGGFFFKQDAKTNRVVALGPGFGGPPEGVDAAIQDSSVDTRNLAIFANANYDLTDRLTASGGLRFTDENKKASILQMVFPGFGLAELLDNNFKRSESYVTATANLQYQVTDDVLGYFTYSRGYKSGGFNVDLVPTEGDLPFQEETVNSFEVGMKSDLMDGRLRLNISAFRAAYDNYQVFQFRFDPFSGTTALLVSNAASVTTKGFEVEGVAILSDQFEIVYGVGFTDATFDNFPGGSVDDEGNPINVAGNRLARAPKWTSSVTGRYNFVSGPVDGKLSVNFTYRGEQFFNPDNRPNSRQPGYGLLNASLDLYFSEHWGVSIWGRNLTDKLYRTMRGISFLGVPFSLYAQPRTYGGEVTYRF